MQYPIGLREDPGKYLQQEEQTDYWQDDLAGLAQGFRRNDPIVDDPAFRQDNLMTRSDDHFEDEGPALREDDQDLDQDDPYDLHDDFQREEISRRNGPSLRQEVYSWKEQNPLSPSTNQPTRLVPHSKYIP